MRFDLYMLPPTIEELNTYRRKLKIAAPLIALGIIILSYKAIEPILLIAKTYKPSNFLPLTQIQRMLIEAITFNEIIFFVAAFVHILCLCACLGKLDWIVPIGSEYIPETVEICRRNKICQEYIDKVQEQGRELAVGEFKAMEAFDKKQAKEGV